MPGKWKANKKRYIVSIVLLLFLNTLLNPSSYAATGEQINESVNNGVQWLIKAQNPSGNWGDYTEKDIPDTTEIAEFLNETGQAPLSVNRAVYWLQNLNPSNNDFSARTMPFITQQTHDEVLSALTACQNPDGGWGLAEGYESDILDTVIVLNSLIKEDQADASIIKNGLGYILQNQNDDGSWSYTRGDAGSVSVTARAVLLLNKCALKTGLASDDLTIALRKAGEFLVAQNLADPSRYSEEMLTGTLLAYRASMNSVGPNSVGPVEDAIINEQQPDGSWHTDAYATLLAIQALKEKKDAPLAKIDGIKLFQQVNDEKVESYSFNAYESVIAEVYGQYDSGVKLQVFVRCPDGLSVIAESDGQFSWNTKNSVTGKYYMVAQLKDINKGTVISSVEKQFDVLPSFNISNVIIKTGPQWARVNSPAGVSVNVSLFNQSNIDRQVDARTEVYGPDGTVIASASETVSCASLDQLIALKPLSFTPDVSVEKEYTIKVLVYDNQAQVAEGQTIFKVLPPPAPTRIDAGQILDKTLLYPGSNNMTTTFKLTGEGTPEMPQRKPVDLVIVIDDSGSMEWGNTDWSYTRPNRMDYAKEASKHVIDLLHPLDRGAVVEFAGTVWTQQDITDDKQLLKKRIDQTPPSPWNGTAIGLGLSQAVKVLDGKSAPERDKVILLLSDGGETSWSYSNVINQAVIANQKNYRVCTLGLGSGADQNLLKAIAATAQASYAFSPTMEQLDEIMRALAGEIFDFAGKKVVFTTTLPVNGMAVDTAAIQPVPDSVVTNSDGSKTISWKFDSLTIGQEKTMQVRYEGSGLLPDTTVILTNATKLTYLDKNDNLVTVDLPDLTIPVSKTSIATNITTDKQQYTANDQVAITVDTKNLSDYGSTLTGLVEITDMDGKTVEVISPGTEIYWNAWESKTFSYSWNSGQVIAGTYKIRVVWSEGNKFIASVEIPFKVGSDGGITNSVTTDKVSYASNETVGIHETVKNTGSNAILTDLTVKTQVLDQAGQVLWDKATPVQEIMPGASLQIKNAWSVAQEIYGDYSVASAVYQGDTVLCQDSAQFTVTSSNQTGQGVSGRLDVFTRNISPNEDVAIQCTLTNQGNSELTGIQRRITVVDPATGEVIDTITDTVNLALNETVSDTITWTHGLLQSGNYLVAYAVTLESETIVPLASSYFSVEQPFEITKQQVVKPRVLVWAESQANTDLATEALEDMQVYYYIVNNRDQYMEELQTGKYNTYVMLNKSLPLTDHDDQILASEINAGKGLIATVDSNGDNLKQFDLIGVKHAGYVNAKQYDASFLPGSSLGEFSLTGSGKIQKVELTGGQQEASINTEKLILPGAITNQYGQGKTALFTFDLGEASPNADAIEALKNAIGYVAPDQNDQGKVAEIEIKVQAKTAVEAMLKEEMPEGAEILWASPEFTSTSPAEWQFSTAPGQEYTFHYIVMLPGDVSTVDLTTYSYYLTAGEYKLLDTTPLTISVP